MHELSPVGNAEKKYKINFTRGAAFAKLFETLKESATDIMPSSHFTPFSLHLLTWVHTLLVICI